uniref:uncharacterized protein LOC128929691 n=1 Tax=Callithrix jacchus TaxID=9483 RepID=UPI0023DD469B|nr:uncharacterized protein LOC128929691 [Callithrix jacchus]
MRPGLRPAKARGRAQQAGSVARDSERLAGGRTSATGPGRGRTAVTGCFCRGQGCQREERTRFDRRPGGEGAEKPAGPRSRSGLLALPGKPAGSRALVCRCHGNRSAGPRRPGFRRGRERGRFLGATTPSPHLLSVLLASSLWAPGPGVLIIAPWPSLFSGFQLSRLAKVFSLDLLRKGWIEAFPNTSESADTVATHLIQDIIPWFGLPATIQSDNGPAFVSKVTNAVCASLGIQWKLHAAYHPQSSGKVERANGLIKDQLTKLSLKLKQSWVSLLPLALTRLRACPRGASQLSPFELLYGRPFLLSTPPSPESSPLNTYLPYFTLLRHLLREHANASIPQTSEIPPALGKVAPGDSVFIKTLTPKPLSPWWEGPYTVILATPTAIKVAQIPSWVHLSRVKKYPDGPSSSRWECVPTGPLSLKLFKP